MKFAVIGLAIAFTNAPAIAQQPTEIVLSAFGGAYTDAIRKNIAQFEQENNATVAFIPASGADALARAMAGEVDVIHADLAWAHRGQAQGLFEALDPAIVTNLEALYPQAKVSDEIVIANFGHYGIAYNPALMDAAPTSWLDLWKPEYAQRITTAGFDAANIELLVLMAKLAGGDEDNIDPGFEKMAELGENISVFYGNHAQLLDLFRNEEVVMARWLRGRVAWAAEQGVELEFVVPEEGAPALVSTLHVVKGRPNIELSQKLVNFLLGEEAQIVLATDLGYTPARAGLDAELADVDVLYGQDVVDSLLISDWEKITPKMDEWKERWDREVAR